MAYLWVYLLISKKKKKKMIFLNKDSALLHFDIFYNTLPQSTSAFLNGMLVIVVER